MAKKDQKSLEQFKVDGESGYCLRLANGQGWHIIATEGVRPWVEKLASIMELEACGPNGCPKLIFIGRESGKDGCGEPICTLDQNMREHLPRSGWRPMTLFLKIWIKLLAIAQVTYPEYRNHPKAKQCTCWIPISSVNWSRKIQTGI